MSAISYQGSDLSSSLLLFDKGEPLNDVGKYYLYIYGANAYNENNVSKAPYEERVKWVNDNMDNIVAMEKEFMVKAVNNFFLQLSL